MRYVLVKVGDLSFAVIIECEPSKRSTRPGAYKPWMRAEHFGWTDGRGSGQRKRSIPSLISDKVAKLKIISVIDYE